MIGCHYQVLAGHRRLAAARKLKWQGLECRTIHGSRERPLVREFFEIHTRAELQQLGPELLGPVCGQLADSRGQKVSAQIDLVMGFHGKRPLPLPKCLREPSK